MQGNEFDVKIIEGITFNIHRRVHPAVRRGVISGVCDGHNTPEARLRRMFRGEVKIVSIYPQVGKKGKDNAPWCGRANTDTRRISIFAGSIEYMMRKNRGRTPYGDLSQGSGRDDIRQRYGYDVGLHEAKHLFTFNDEGRIAGESFAEALRKY